MYSTRAFLRGFEMGRGTGTGSNEDTKIPGVRRLKVLKTLKNSEKAMTVFELAVKVPDRPNAVYDDLKVMSNVHLVVIEGEGDDAVVSLTGEGVKYLSEIGQEKLK